MCERIAELFYPRRCVFCTRVLSAGEPDAVCPDCAAGLPRTEGSEQWRSGRTFSRCYAPLYYTGTVRDAILRFKFHRFTGYAKTFGTMMAQVLPPRAQFTAVTWVPVSFLRRRKRGYDQARLLAAQVAKELGLPLKSTLRKVRNTPPQSSLSGSSARKSNVSGVYRPRRHIPPGSYLLVDDIFTTGATLSEAAGTLRRAGVQEICAVTAARTQAKSEAVPAPVP